MYFAISHALWQKLGVQAEEKTRRRVRGWGLFLVGAERAAPRSRLFHYSLRSTFG